MSPRLSLAAILLLTVVFGGCSKPSNGPPPAGKAMFMGCPITTNGEDFTGGGSAIPKAIYSNNGLRVYAVGVVKTPNSTVPDKAIVRISDDGGKTFSTLNEFSGATNNAIVADSTNTHIYVAQTLSSSPIRSSIHYTLDGGQSWSDVAYQFNGQNNETISSITLNEKNEPVFVGTSEDSLHNKTGFVVKLSTPVLKPAPTPAEASSPELPIPPVPELLLSVPNAEFKQIATQKFPSSAESDLLIVGSTFSNSGSLWFLERWSSSDHAKLVEDAKTDSKITADDIKTKSWTNLSDGFANQLDVASDEAFLNLKKFARIYPELTPVLKDAKAASDKRIDDYNKAVKDAKAKSLPEPTPAPAPPILTGLSGKANAILVTPDNFIFVAGTVGAPNPKSEKPPESDVWVVRRSIVTGTNFAISDLFNDTSFKTLTPNALVNYDNHVLAIGGSKKASTGPQDTNPDSHWHVRGAQDRFSGWVTLANPKFSSSPQNEEEEATAVGGVMTGTGDHQTLIVLGNSHDKDAKLHHWRIQKTTSCK